MLIFRKYDRLARYNIFVTVRYAAVVNTADGKVVGRQIMGVVAMMVLTSELVGDVNAVSTDDGTITCRLMLESMFQALGTTQHKSVSIKYQVSCWMR